MDKKYNYFSSSSKLYMIIIAVLIIALFLSRNWLAGGVAFCLYAVLMIYDIKNTKAKKGEWEKFIEEFSSKFDIATRSTLTKLPLPLMMIGNDGNVLWYNQNFSSVFDTKDLLGNNTSKIIKEFKVSQVLDGKKNNFKSVKISEGYYDIYTSIISTSDKIKGKEDIVLMYFIDVTEVHRLRVDIEDLRETVMLIEVDNLDEALKTIEDDRKPLLIAEIERTINNYAQSVSAMVKKYSSNKYILTIQDKYVKTEMQKKFEILDSIRELNLGNKFAVTLSIGIGRGGSNPIENYNYAIAAKELALGRGGDQAVVKKADKLAFYGGKTKEVEKKTKVRARVIAHALVGLVKESSKVFIMGHTNPDVDCVGAAVGLHSVSSMLQKECYIVMDGVNNSIKNVMDKINEDPSYKNVFITSEQCRSMIDDMSLLIVVDVHSKNYIQNEELASSIKRIVIVDHHRKCPDCIEGTLLSYIEPYASSTSELVTEMIQYMVENPKIKSLEAEVLLAGICVDTKNFYFKTGVRTFEAASFLRKLGADTIDVKKMFSNNLDSYIKKADIIKSAVIKENMAIAICPDEIADTVIAAQAADELLNITGIQASFVIVKIGEEVFISGRSLGDVNVQLILETLGGGGHMTMAGARLKDVSQEEAIKLLKEAIDKYLREGEKQ